MMMTKLYPSTTKYQNAQQKDMNGSILDMRVRHPVNYNVVEESDDMANSKKSFLSTHVVPCHLKCLNNFA